MPNYDYQCKSCELAFEVFQKITDKHKRKCPECGKFALERLIGATSFSLKGGGWYSDGYSNVDRSKKGDGNSE